MRPRSSRSEIVRPPGFASSPSSTDLDAMQPTATARARLPPSRSLPSSFYFFLRFMFRPSRSGSPWTRLLSPPFSVRSSFPKFTQKLPLSLPCGCFFPSFDILTRLFRSRRSIILSCPLHWNSSIGSMDLCGRHCPVVYSESLQCCLHFLLALLGETHDQGELDHCNEIAFARTMATTPLDV